MNSLSSLSFPEKAILAFGLVLGLIGLVLSHANPPFFTEVYVLEDGLIEWLTVVALVASATLMLRRAWVLKGERSSLFVFTTVMAAAVFLFGAGEEISWGQRIFGIETPEWFAENNKQRETNLHNLVIGGVSVNKLVFSKILAVCLLGYLVILPWVAKKKPAFAAFLDRAGVPLPRTWHVVVWIAVLLLTEYAVGTGKRGELREFLLTTILFVQLLNPANHWIYDRTSRPQE